MTAPGWISSVKFDDRGLVPAVVQDAEDGAVLMMAWMNRDALIETHGTRRGVFWSRSREKIWRKGEESGHVQDVVDMRLDCDGDVVLLKVRQRGEAACHTGHRSCFYRRVNTNGSTDTVGEPLFDPKKVYKK